MAFQTRQTKMSDLPLFVQWMNEENWYVSLNLLKACYLIDPEGWMTAETKDKEPIGSIAGCILNEKVAFGGFFFVRKDWRRTGVGKMLFDKHFKHIGDRNYGVNSIDYRVEKNLKEGLGYMSFSVCSYIGVPYRSKLDDSHAKSLVKYTPNLFECLCVYDTEVHTIPREKFLRVWINIDLTTTYCALDGSIIKGYGCIQPIDGGHYRIGPLFADTPELAQSLFTKLLLSVPEDKQVIIDIHSDNALSMSMVEEHGMEMSMKLYRMYTKQKITFRLENVYAFTTMDIALV